MKNIAICLILFINAFLTHSDIIDDEKPVFDRSFPNNQNYLLNDCIPIAFADFNADKIVDIFCRNTDGNSIRIMLNSDRSTKTKEQYRMKINGIIHDGLAADFDGDSKLDLLLIYKNRTDQNGYNAGFLWGDREKLSELQPLKYRFQTIPTTLDINGDSYIDLLGMIKREDADRFQPACLTFKNRSVLNFMELSDVEDLLPNSTQATVDLNNDLAADLFLTLNYKNQPKFRVNKLPISQMSMITEYLPPADAAVYHLSIFADIDANGRLEHLLPLCMDPGCLDSRIYVREDNEWHQLSIHFPDHVRFPSKNEQTPPFDRIPFSIKMADYNLDGYPDILAVVKYNSVGVMVPMIFQNRPCQGLSNISCFYNRTFEPQTDETLLLSTMNTSFAVFFDLLENGYPDILVLQHNGRNNFTLTGFQNTLTQDVHFIKVMVLSSFSCETCSHQFKLPYGNNQPGQSIKMETITTSNGIQDLWIQLAAVQVPQSGQMTLELPYVIIGLGATPNFVEKITVSLPPNPHAGLLTHIYTQMIPNSQVVVIPSPLTQPERWPSRLFITASRMILHTGIALAATLVMIAIIMAALQCREKLDDDRERKEQSQSFHFDAL